MSKLILIASTKQGVLNGIGRGPSLNKNGLVAFTGMSASGQGIYVGNGTALKGGGPFRNINPRFSSNPNHKFGNYVQINDSGKVAARDQDDGSPFQTFVRVWDSQISNAYTIIGEGGAASDKFSEIMICPSINNAVPDGAVGQVVFGALPKSPPYAPVLATPIPGASGGADFNQVVLSSNLLLPRIADNGRIVVSARNDAISSIGAYTYNLSGDPDDIAYMSGSSPSFSEIGGNPGISGDGQIIAFYGNLTPEAANAWSLTPGPGIFASILITGIGWTLHRVADIGDSGLTEFVKDGFVGVNSVRMFTYLGKDSAGNQGIYMTRLSFFSAAPPAPDFRAVAQPALIAAQGATLNLADGSSLGIVQDIDIADSPNIRGDVVFWVQTDDQNQSIALMPRCCFGDYQDQVHSTYINQHATGNASQAFPIGLPKDSKGRRGGNACGASALTMLLNSVSYVGNGGQASRYGLPQVYRAVAKRQPIVAEDKNWYDLEKAVGFVKSLGFFNAKYVVGKAAIDAQLDSYVAVVASTRFGSPDENGTAKWGGGHIVLLLHRTPADPEANQEGFYIVDDPAGYVTPTSAAPLGHYGARFCGEHVIYPESMVAQALWRQDDKLGLVARGGVALNPARGAAQEVMLISGMFTGLDSRPFQLWLEDPAGRRTGWLPDGRAIEEIPNSVAIISAIVVSDPSSLPWDSPEEATWPYAASVSSSEPGISVFIYGNLHADYSLETLLFTTRGVIRSVTTGIVAQGETQQVTLTAPALYKLTLSGSSGGRVSASPVPGPYPDGAQVAVTALPDMDYVFAGYTIDGIPGYLSQPLTLYMDADHTVTAEFRPATL